jgi:hypothetical protein
MVTVTLPIGKIIDNIDSTGKQGKRHGHSHNLIMMEYLPSMIKEHTNKHEAILQPLVRPHKMQQVTGVIQ